MVRKTCVFSPSPRARVLERGPNTPETSLVVEVKPWTVYDMKEAKLLELTHEEFKQLLLDRPAKLTGNFMTIDSDRIWVDAILNRN